MKHAQNGLDFATVIVSWWVRLVVRLICYYYSYYYNYYFHYHYDSARVLSESQ